MFKELISKLASIVRFDRIANTRDVRIGKVKNSNGSTQLAMRLPITEVVTLEPRAQQQLLSGWSLPSDHSTRLPRGLPEN
jgi:hypothetical protein